MFQVQDKTRDSQPESSDAQEWQEGDTRDVPSLRDESVPDRQELGVSPTAGVSNGVVLLLWFEEGQHLFSQDLGLVFADLSRTIRDHSKNRTLDFPVCLLLCAA